MEKKPFEVVNFLKNNPEKVKEMVKYNEIIKNVEDLSMTIVDTSKSSIILAKKFAEEYGFLTNDALHIAVMKQNNLINLVSNDADFERVDWLNTKLKEFRSSEAKPRIKLYKPSRS